MSKAHYLVHEQNMIEMISGGNFYGEEDAFLRELLQNAYDACYTREELQMSWGAEFLAVQTDKVENFIRAMYTPKIVITYRTNTQLFTMEDNGIGMDTSDFDKYFRRMGASYYTGPEYQEQRMNYVPIGRFGLGMLACFGVSGALTLESRKDKSINTAWNKEHFSKLIPIHVFWDKKDEKITIDPGKKMTSGTIIGLRLNKEIAGKMSLPYLKERIEHYMAFQNIPIEIRVDEKSMVLNRTKLERETHLLDVKGLHVITLDDDLMEGYLTIYHEQHEEMIERSVLYQQGFYVTSDEEQVGLKPEWIRCMNYRINMKSRYLNLRCNRDAVVKDKKLQMIRRRIGLKIIAHFQSNPSGIVQYLKSGRKNIFSSYEKEVLFLTSAVRILIYRKGQKADLPMQVVLDACAGRTIRVAAISERLFDYYQERYPDSCDRWIQEYDMLLFDNHMHVFLQLVSAYIQKKEYRIMDEAGMVCLELEIDMPVAWSKIPYQDNYIWKDCMLSSKCNTVMCFSCNDHNGLLELMMNPSHPFIYALNHTNVTPSMRVAWSVILENIKRRIISKTNRCGKIIDFQGGFVDFWKDERVITLESVGCLEKNYPEMMNAYIREQVPAVELNRMGLDDMEFRGEDFVEWWFEDYWDGN